MNRGEAVLRGGMKWKGTFSSFFATVAALARSSAGPLRLAAGPLLTLAMAATIELLPFGRMSAAPLALVLTVGYSALTGGVRSGLVSGAIAAAFCGYYYWNARSAGPLQHYAEPDVERLVVLGMATPVVVLTLARLRKRVDLMSVRERQLRVQAEADRARLEDILESITDGFFAIDRQWRYVYVNREAERLVCRGRDELLGKTVWESFPPLVGSAWDREYRRALEQNVAVHVEAFYAPLDTWLETHAYRPRRV